ncbi:MauE/DoxX family redox-associated membrane protein [Nonomuraea sp. NPDC048916]|uniref:MauE/DoxX family redox-associated membrane protein n=1 Tax=Nonomuraea sp. NPDC048916 TaxID=3154232 RepID=UPI0033E47E30
MAYLVPACQGLLAVIFLASAASKLRSGRALRAFAASLAAMRLVRGSHAKPVAVAFALAEVAVPALLVVPSTREAGLAAAALLLAVLTAGVAVVLLRRTARPCRCFGASSVPLSGRHLVRNVLLTVAALAGLASPEGPLPPVGALAAVLGGALAGLLVVVMDDILALFTPAPTSQRRPDGLSSDHGSGRTAGSHQSAVHRRRHTPVA